jgi:glycosyltransferase involved in cell wall biosynthesis
MRIMMVTYEYPPYLFGGLGTHCQQLARGLVRRGHDVFVLSYCLDNEWVCNDEGVSVRYLRFPIPNRKHLYDGTVAEVAILQEQLSALTRDPLLTFAPDVIHVHEWLAYVVAKPLIAHFQKPQVVTLHGLWAEQTRRWGGGPEARAGGQLEKLCCQEADKVIAVSEAVRKWIVENFQLESSRVAVVHNGSNFPAAVDPIDPHSDPVWRALHRGGKKLIVFAGRLVKQKGVAALLNAAPSVLDRHPEACYVVAGDTGAGSNLEYIEQLRQLRGDLLLNSRVCFLGKLTATELADLYRFATAAVIPSIYEPFGYAATEAMASGIPVIASDVDGLAEIVDDEKTGLLVRFGNDCPAESSRPFIQALGEAQCRILEDNVLAETIARGGQRKAKDSFGIEPMLDKTISVYEQVLTASQPRFTQQ